MLDYAEPAFWAALFCAAATSIQLISISLALIQCRRKPGPLLRARPDAPPVSIVRPVCGLDAVERETLDSTYRLDYPSYEVIFCVADAGDPVVPLVLRLIEAHPAIPSQLIIGDEAVSANPKLNNVVRGWDAARHAWIVIADSNVLMPADYVQRLMARWDDKTGLVCATPIGARPQSFWAEIECAFLNTFQARWQYAGAALGFAFAQGKTMLWRRAVLDDNGGIRALGSEIAEDAAATKLVHRAGLTVRLVDNPFEQPLGVRSFRQIWSRQVRWARLRRVTFPLFFTPEIITGSFWPLIAGAYAAVHYEVSAPGMVLALMTVWYGAEIRLGHAAGWRLTWITPVCYVIRDCLLPILWVDAWIADDFVWRGNAMTVADAPREEPSGV